MYRCVHDNVSKNCCSRSTQTGGGNVQGNCLRGNVQGEVSKGKCTFPGSRWHVVGDDCYLLRESTFSSSGRTCHPR